MKSELVEVDTYSSQLLLLTESMGCSEYHLVARGNRVPVNSLYWQAH